MTAKSPLENISDAYRAMATEALYRPAAPSDGLGNITVPLEELDLDTEAWTYARAFQAEEDTMSFFIGCTDFAAAKATVYVIEAARNLCAGLTGREPALRLLTMATKELEETPVPDWWKG